MKTPTPEEFEKGLILKAKRQELPEVVDMSKYELMQAYSDYVQEQRTVEEPTKEYFKSLGAKCFEYLKKVNPSGGMKEFVRMAVEFGYKANKKDQRTVDEREYLLDFLKHLDNVDYTLPIMKVDSFLRIKKGEQE